MVDDSSFRSWVRRQRKGLDLTQAELAERLGYSPQLIQKIESGRRRPSKQFVEALVRHLGLAPQEREVVLQLARSEHLYDSAPDTDRTSVSSNLPAGSTRTLPAQPTPLLGREDDVEAAQQLLACPDVRLLTLVGPPGVGKTRLGIRVAAQMHERFEDGVCFVALTAVTDPDLIVPTVARALGLREGADDPAQAALRCWLRDKSLLLLLDNCEQVQAACTVAELLAACPGLKVLATSRVPLHVRGEQLYPVQPLALPDLRRLPDLQTLSRYPSFDLFVRRARAQEPSFALTPENAPAVAELCAGADGLPLAIELLAARSRALSPRELLAQLGNRLALLTGGPRDAPERHRTLRAAIDWSYALLSPHERRLFARLGAFVGGCTLEATGAVCDDAGEPSGPLPPDLLDGLASLVDASLLRRVDSAAGEHRYSMLETMREYAVQRLEESGEAEAVRQRHAEYHLKLAERAVPRLVRPEQGAWLARLEKEHDNLRAALIWSLEQGAGCQLGLRLATALNRLWELHGYRAEGQRWLGLLLDRCGQAPPQVLAGALHEAGILARDQGEYGDARRLLERSVALHEQSGDDKQGLADSLNTLGVVALYERDFARAEPLLEASLALRREFGRRPGIAKSLNNLGLLAMYTGDYARARVLHGQSYTLRRAERSTQAIATSLNNLGQVALCEGEPERAATLCRKSLGIYRELGDGVRSAESLQALAAIAAEAGDHRRAAQLWGTVEALRRNIGAPMPPVDRAFFAPYLSTARACMGEEAWEASLAEGRAMTPEDACVYALAAAHPAPAPRRT